MNTYVRESINRKWHTARRTGRATLPGDYTPTLCNRTVKARHFTNDRRETDSAGLCYQCGKSATSAERRRDDKMGEGIYISPQWTQKERATLVSRLRRELDSCTGGKAFDVEERIHFLVTMPAAFLEANRDTIVGGNVIPEADCFGSPETDREGSHG